MCRCLEVMAKAASPKGFYPKVSPAHEIVMVRSVFRRQSSVTTRAWRGRDAGACGGGARGIIFGAASEYFFFFNRLSYINEGICAPTHFFSTGATTFDATFWGPFAIPNRPLFQFFRRLCSKMYLDDFKWLKYKRWPGSNCGLNVL